jgi:hypothetical protein
MTLRTPPALDGPAAILLEVLPDPDEIPDGLLLRGGHPDRGELAGAVQPGQVAGVQAVRLDVDPGTAGDQGGAMTSQGTPREVRRRYMAGSLRMWLGLRALRRQSTNSFLRTVRPSHLG